MEKKKNYYAITHLLQAFAIHWFGIIDVCHTFSLVHFVFQERSSEDAKNSS